jgi:prephenate dehydrogenase
MKGKTDELETRVANRKLQLITEIIEHKKNSSRYGAAEAIDKIKHHLSELAEIVKAHEWPQLSAAARLRLVDWVAR